MKKVMVITAEDNKENDELNSVEWNKFAIVATENILKIVWRVQHNMYAYGQKICVA